MTKVQTQAEQRKFTIDPSIIYHIISAQAGTLGKALLECVMNSIDAAATQVNITLEPDTVIIQDDGRGFRSRQEIEEWFEVFGFPHNERGSNGNLERVYGQFGVGRGQLWSFASTQWRTNEFLMDVDIKTRGLVYELQIDLRPVSGLTITGQFYEVQAPSALGATERELAELAAYAQIPVIVNGRQINKLPSELKWPYETNEAWIRLKESGDLWVYNLGVLVRKYPAHHLGSGGTVVTKPKVELQLNMARNDILVAKCPVWKNIRAFIQSKSDERIDQSPALSDDEREHIALRIKAGEMDISKHLDLKIFTTVAGRHCGLRTLFQCALPITVSPENGSRIADKVHQSKIAFVLNRATLDRFNIATPTELQQVLLNSLTSHSDQWERHRITNLKMVDDFETCTASLKEGYDLVPEKNWTKDEKRVMAALRAGQKSLWMALRYPASATVEYVSRVSQRRALQLGESDLAEAWTDGHSVICMERRQLKHARAGLAGFYRLMLLIAHEYLHDAPTAGSHLHDQEYFEKFHDFSIDCWGVHAAATLAFKTYVEKLEKDGVRLNKKIWASVDALSILLEQNVKAEADLDEMLA